MARSWGQQPVKMGESSINGSKLEAVSKQCLEGGGMERSLEKG